MSPDDEIAYILFLGKLVFIIAPWAWGTFAGQWWYGSRAENIQQGSEFFSTIAYLNMIEYIYHFYLHKADGFERRKQNSFINLIHSFNIHTLGALYVDSSVLQDGNTQI